MNKLVYIAGPYRDAAEWQVFENILLARKYALDVWRNGGIAICPHLNTMLFGGAPGCTDEMWLAGDLEILKRCDAVYAMIGYGRSEGARNEIALAKREGIPVLFCAKEMRKFLRGVA